MTFADIEREIILRTVSELGIKSAVETLDISKTTIYRKLKQYKSPPPPQVQETPLYISARKCANYMLRCVGTARELGEELDRELNRWRNTRIMNHDGKRSDGDSGKR